MATIVFGGSFDPIHLGHLAMAKAALDYLPAAKLLLIPAACSPFKTNRTMAENEHRLAMCRLAAKHDERISVSDIEFHLPKPSFTVHTIHHLLNNQPDQYYFLCGADSFLTLPKWKAYETLAKSVTFLVANRCDCQHKQLQDMQRHISNIGGQAVLLSMPLVEVSSTQIRKQLQDQQSLAGLVLPEVERYLVENALYRE